MAGERVATVTGYGQERMTRSAQHETPSLAVEAMIVWRWETKAMSF